MKKTPQQQKYSEVAVHRIPSVYYAGTHVMCAVVNVHTGANGSGEWVCWHLLIVPHYPRDCVDTCFPRT
jgi:hypothetical protein